MTQNKQGKNSLPKSDYNRYIMIYRVLVGVCRYFVMMDDFAGLGMVNVHGLC